MYIYISIICHNQRLFQLGESLQVALFSTRASVRNIITFPSGIVKKKHQGMTAFRPSQEEFDKGKKRGWWFGT